MKMLFCPPSYVVHRFRGRSRGGGREVVVKINHRIRMAKKSETYLHVMTTKGELRAGTLTNCLSPGCQLTGPFAIAHFSLQIHHQDLFLFLLPGRGRQKEQAG